MTAVNDDVSGLSPPAAYELGRSDERIVIQDEIARLRAQLAKADAVVRAAEEVALHTLHMSMCGCDHEQNDPQCWVGRFKEALAASRERT